MENSPLSLRIAGKEGLPPLYFKSIEDDPHQGVDLGKLPCLGASYYYVGVVFSQLLREKLQLDVPLPCWVLQEAISEKLFGTKGLNTQRLVEKNMAPTLFAPEFANVHVTFDWDEPPLEIDGVRYESGGPEAYFQGQKSVGTPDEKRVQKLMATASPDDAFGIGRTHAMRPDWDDIKDQVMYKGVHAKFSRNSALKRLLLMTGNLPLGQIKPHDAYWGSGPDGKGANALGKTLVAVREQLRSQK